MERKTVKIVAAFAKRLKKDFSDAKIILFGSRARGEQLLDSDYDFIIVSKSFEGTPFYERMEKIYDYWEEKQAIEPLCYTPKEFEEKKEQIGIVQQAIKNGTKIA